MIHPVSPPGVAQLSPRQKECLRLVYRLKTSKEISSELDLSEGTVHAYCAKAVATLGARNRRHAAEILHFAESEVHDELPREVEFNSAGVETGAPPGPSESDEGSSPDWRWLLPFRLSGAADNDLSILLRLLWIPVLAAILAVGFGAVLSGLGVLSDLLGRPHG